MNYKLLFIILIVMTLLYPQNGDNSNDAIYSVSIGKDGILPEKIKNITYKGAKIYTIEEIEFQEKYPDHLKDNQDYLDGSLKKRIFYKNFNINYEKNKSWVIEKLFMDGLYTEWYGNGQKKIEGTYKVYDTDSGGKILIAIKNTQKYLPRNFRHMNLSLKDSLWTEWYTNGNVKSKGTYVRGVMDGEWEFNFENGNLNGKGSYSYLLIPPVDVYTRAFEGVEKNPLGNSGVPINGRVGKWIFNYENGMPKQESIYKSDKDGKMYDLFTLWYKNGQKKIEGTKTSDNKKKGKWFYYNEDGTLNKMEEY